MPALDGLRAAAVIAVLLFHAGHLQGGFLGVDLFFALSGFLITSLLIRDADNGGIELTQFWGRRFRRLLPAVFVMIAAVAVWSWLFGSAADLDGVKSDGIFGLLYVANWHFIADSSGYWASFAQPSMFDHLWSLAIEEQFYVVWPLVVLGIWRGSKRPQRTLLIVAIAGVVASLTAMLLLYDGGDPTRVYMGTDTRAASLLMGVIAATNPARSLARRLAAYLGSRLGLVIALIAGGILCSWFVVDGAGAGLLYRGGLLAHSAACALLIALVVCSQQGRVSRHLGWGPLVWIGVISYGLYLWHWPLYVILSPERTGLDGVGLTVVRIAASVVAAYISYKIVEDPLRHRVSWVRGRRGVGVLVASVVGLVALLVVLPEPDTEIAAFDPASISVALPVTPVAPRVSPVDAPSSGPAGASDPVRAGDLVGAIENDPESIMSFDAAILQAMSRVAPVATPIVPPPTISAVAWAGDSVAFELAPAVKAALVSAGLTVNIGAAYPGVRLLGPIEVRRLTTQVPNRLAEISADTLIIMVSTWDQDIDNENYAAGLRELADLLPPDGRLIVLSAPPAGDDARNAQYDRLAAVARETAAKSEDRIVFIDASQPWVTPTVRDANGDGAPERKPDLIHVCPAGAAGFALWLTLELDARFSGLEPADPSTWLLGDWGRDVRYDQPVGACAPL